MQDAIACEVAGMRVCNGQVYIYLADVYTQDTLGIEDGKNLEGFLLSTARLNRRMSLKIIQFQDLQAKDINAIDDHQLLFRGQLFRLGPKISKKLEQAALEYCQICCKAGQICLLQESDTHWIVWKQVRKVRRPIVAESLAPSNTLSSDFLDRCKQELMKCIGPVADLVVEQTLSEWRVTPIIEPQEFIKALSQRIPSSSMASMFHDHCQKATQAEILAARVRTVKLASPGSRYAFNRSKMVHFPVSI